MFYPYGQPIEHADARKARAWIEDARAEAVKITAINLPGRVTAEPFMWGCLITAANGTRHKRATLHWEHVKHRAGSPFREHVQLLAEAVGLRLTPVLFPQSLQL